MNRDELTYSRATTAALAGLAVQIVLCVATGLIGAWAQSPAIQAATWHIAGGIPIWIILAIIYQQHRVERTESLAAEKLATQDATSAAIFGETSDELQLARNRLDRLYAYGLPAVSFAVALYLIAAGAAMLYRAAGLGTDRVALSLAKDCNPVGLMFATAGVAFVAFIAARWISGYTRVREWQLLRGGASYLMSTFLVAALLFAGAAAVAIVKETTFFEWLARLVPWMMILVGGEILLTALLAAYRPKRPGEIPRPAFDSRFLGLLTAPESLGQVVGELINYQFGVEVSRSWFYQMLGRAVTPLTVFAGAVLFALSTLVIVGPDEQGTVLRHGALARGPLGPGMHLKAPWPIETSEIYPTGKVLQLTISSDKLGRFKKKREGLLWTGGDDDAAKMGLEFFLCASETGDGSGSSLSLLVADVIVQYRIGDLVKFLEGSTSARESIELVTQQEASNYFAGKTLEELLSKGRTEGGPELQKRIQARVDALGLVGDRRFFQVQASQRNKLADVSQPGIGDGRVLQSQQNHVLQRRHVLQVRIHQRRAAVLEIDFERVAVRGDATHGATQLFDPGDGVIGGGDRLEGRGLFRSQFQRRHDRDHRHDNGDATERREFRVVVAHASSSLIALAVGSASGIGRLPGPRNS